MSDLINRQALCDDLREYKVHPVSVFSSDESEVKGYNDGIDLAISVIAEFPATKPERTAKVISDDVIITVNGYRYHYEEYLCNACKKKIFSCDSYCSHCGAKLDWNGNE